MPVHNADIADAFSEMADLLELRQDNPFRNRAYRNAARGRCAAPVIDVKCFSEARLASAS